MIVLLLVTLIAVDICCFAKCMRHKAGHTQYSLGRWGWQSSNMATSFFGHLPLSLSLLYACPCPSPVTKQDALNYTRTLPSPFLRPLFVFSPFSHNCCATTVAADQATNIKFEINKSKQFSRPGDMQGKRGVATKRAFEAGL